MVSAHEFFMGFSRYYSSLGIKFQESISVSTNRITSYVDTLGRMLGYRIFSELSCSNLLSAAGLECPAELRKMRPDICWGYYDDQGKTEYELVLEAEQSMNDEKIAKDLTKLFLFPSKLKVLYCAHENPKRVVEIAQEVAKSKQQGFSGNLLLIVDPWIDRKTFSKGQLLGVHLGNDLEGLALGRADVASYREGPWDVRVFKNSKWEPIKGPIQF